MFYNTRTLFFLNRYPTPHGQIKHIPQVHSITFYCFSRFLLSTAPFSSSQMCAQLRHLSVLCLCVCVCCRYVLMLFNALPPLGMRCCRVCLLLSHASLTVKCASVCTHVFNHHANKYYLQSVVYFDMPSRHHRSISRAHLNVSLCMCALTPLFLSLWYLLVSGFISSTLQYFASINTQKYLLPFWLGWLTMNGKYMCVVPLATFSLRCVC